ncbi:MAG: ATP-dependent DNA helicase [Gammaproteobacteria bacterium]|nr:ATP-dependent DNA helicase [Gammaproteobacteria bacterium]
MKLFPTPAELLSEQGPLASAISGFLPRASQQAMADAIGETLDNGDSLVCEAGTGTGKTFAYLTPALVSGKKVIISTGTKNLQDQLFHRDLPVVRDALKLPVSIALLKGRANYLCLQRLQQSGQTGELFPDRRTVDHFEQVRAWAGRTRAGDIAELSGIPEKSEVWRKVTSTAENCLGQQCPKFNQCYLLKARRKACEADVLVINHYLFFADMALRDEGFGELLPGTEAVILDEAHQLADIATNFFGIAFSGKQCDELCRDSIAAEKIEAGDCPDIARLAGETEQATRNLRAAFGKTPQRSAWHVLSRNTAFGEALTALRDKLKALENALKEIAKRGKALESCSRRSGDLSEHLELITVNPPEDQVQWFETFPRGFMLHLTPLAVADGFQSFREAQKCAWVFTSATLSVAGNFSHFCNELGVVDARTERWESPFDFSRSALFYVPQGMPEPRNSGFTQATVNAALPILAASRGRAFLLFTSHRALQEAAELLENKKLDFPLLVQGSMPRNELLAQFRTLGNAILLGTGSFWEGVDVRGEALSCVIIDKLPFASPGDPVMEARIKHMRNNGGNPFMDYQLPQAAIALKQGTGRLIRDVTDRGVLVLCDPRLVSKPYGRVFLDSLPPMPKTRRLEKVQAFFANDDMNYGVSRPSVQCH